MDTLTRKARSELMSRIRSKRTRPEMRLHGLLKAMKVAHAMWPGIVGNPDVLAGRAAVFMHGCFWHGCSKHFKLPKTNRKFWAAKIARNKARHRRAERALRRAGYAVVVVWEHDLTAAAARRGRSAAEARRVSRTARSRPSPRS